MSTCRAVLTSAVHALSALAPEDSPGIILRQPRDGTRVEVVGTSQGPYFSRADTNNWYDAINLTLDGELPLNSRYSSALAAVTAERLLEAWTALFEPTPALSKRTARANAALMQQNGRARSPVQPDYF